MKKLLVLTVLVAVAYAKTCRPNSCTGFNVWQDPKTCKCYCDIIFKCTSLQRYSHSACDCKCRRFLKCPRPQYFNRTTCTCECPSTINCPGAQIPLKSNGCACGCPAVQPVCRTDQYWDSTDCRCVCRQCQQCTSLQSYDNDSCSCKCNNVLNCDLNKFFNNDTCQCQCVNDTSATCNQMTPFYGWNEATCNCDFCPNNALRKSSCEAVPKYWWDASSCSCSFCPLRSQGIIDCANQASPYGWNETACDCQFCLNRYALKTNCTNSGSSYAWNDTSCSCTYIPPPLTGGDDTSGGQITFNPATMDFGSVLGIFTDVLTGIFYEATTNLTMQDLLAMVFNSTEEVVTTTASTLPLP